MTTGKGIDDCRLAIGDCRFGDCRMTIVDWVAWDPAFARFRELRRGKPSACPP
jgi:hypothetical protein